MTIQLISIPDKFNSFRTYDTTAGRSCNTFVGFVRWYDKADDCRSRFHCQIGNDDEKICNIELWKRDFYELSRDCIILIHSILGCFIASTMKIGKKNPKEYLSVSVISINKKIHI